MDSHPSARSIVGVIFAAVLIWGVIHAIGAFRGAADTAANPWRGAVVLASFAIFLGLWWVTLVVQAKKASRRRDE